ncbi:MAG: malate synthase, partial [Solirubrobacteraceae bacterium]|nr:malate synthase [Solirubrobacteraceae bacterium]
LFELREHSYGLNAGRWDYIFSAIKCFRERPEFVLPDRSDVTMNVPFMRAYAELLVATCHRRGAFAMGGMAALVPARDDAAATARAVAAVQADKQREAGMGFDGTWVAHPDVVAVARAEFDAVLGASPNQLTRRPAAHSITAGDLLAVDRTPGAVTAAGVRGNVAVTCRYLDAWLDGRGAVAINNLMEDAATAEIARTQLWQWIRHAAPVADGGTVTRSLVEALLDEEIARLEADGGRHPHRVRALVTRIVLAETLPEFLTTAGLDLLEEAA